MEWTTVSVEEVYEEEVPGGWLATWTVSGQTVTALSLRPAGEVTPDGGITSVTLRSLSPIRAYEAFAARKALPPPDVARRIREEAGLSQTELAERLGTHYLTVNRWECGHTKPRGPVLLAYVDLLKELAGVTA